MMIYSGVTCRRRRLREIELDVRRSRQEPGTMDGVRPKTHRPGMEPRNRGGDAPPRRAARRWTVEDRRLGGPGGIVVCCAVRRARSFRAAAAVSLGHGAALSTRLGRLASSQSHDISRPAGGLSLQSLLDRLDQSVRSEGFFEQHVTPGFTFEPGDVRIAGAK